MNCKRLENLTVKKINKLGTKLGLKATGRIRESSTKTGIVYEAEFHAGNGSCVWHIYNRMSIPS